MDADLEIATRSEFGDLLHRLGFTADDSAIEVGVHRGEFARQLLVTWQGLLVLVDPWQNNMPGYVDPVASGNRTDDWRACIERLHGFESHYIIAHMTSEMAAEKTPKHYAAFVYIDANHAYEHVKADIERWWPKVAPGGILAGHDWTGEWKGNVRRAVREFAAAQGLDIHVVMERGGETERSWYFRKPKATT